MDTGFLWLYLGTDAGFTQYSQVTRGAYPMVQSNRYFDPRYVADGGRVQLIGRHVLKGQDDAGQRP